MTDTVALARALAVTPDRTAQVWISYGPTDQPARWVLVIAQCTASEDLFVTPVISDGNLTGWWRLTHGPTGKWLPTPDINRLPQLVEVAAEVADLDWFSADGEDYAEPASPHRARLNTAVRKVLGLPT